jgi:hypothetical protein
MKGVLFDFHSPLVVLRIGTKNQCADRLRLTLRCSSHWMEVPRRLPRHHVCAPKSCSIGVAGGRVEILCSAGAYPVQFEDTLSSAEKRGLVTWKGSGQVRVETVVDPRRNIVQV